MDAQVAHQSLFDHAMAELRKAQLGELASCKICEGRTEVFDIIDFNKSCMDVKYPLGFAFIPVPYLRCTRCGFIFTSFCDGFSDEDWRSHVYNDDYIKVDPEYADYRPRLIAQQLAAFLDGKKDVVLGLDYGGGNGTTTKVMREHGWQFDCYDPFGSTDLTPERKGKYNFCCAMEVFEHVTKPIATLQAIVDLASPGPLTIMIGTGIHDGIVSDQTRLNWSYAAPRNGHVSLYSREALRALGSKFGLSYAGIMSGPHLLLRGLSEREARVRLLRGKVLRRWRSALKITR